MNAAHTPGPWVTIANHDFSVDHDGDCDGPFEDMIASGFKVIGNPEYSDFAVVVCDMNERNVWNDQLLDANARLIAAAPELLDALSLVVGSLKFDRDGDLNREVLRRINTAIAKATGQ